MAELAKSPPMTAEEFAAWADDPSRSERRFILDAGRPVEMASPKRAHGFVNWLLIRVLTKYVDVRGGYLLTHDTGMILSRGPDTILAPDVILFLTPPAADESSRWVYVEADVPQLVVEVRSPTDRDSRILRRVMQYHRYGVPLVWVIDPEDRVATSYRPDEFPKVLDETDDLTGNGVLPAFACKVSEFFTLPGPAPTA